MKKLIFCLIALFCNEIQAQYVYGNRTFYVGSSFVAPSSLTNGWILPNGVAPTTTFTDGVILYAADRESVAGKSSLHLKTEDGSNIVLGDLSGIGTTTPISKLHISDGNTLSASFTGTYTTSDLFISGNSTIGLRYGIASNTAAVGGVVSYSKARGTVTSPSALSSGDFIGGQLYGGHDGTSFNYGAAIYSYCDGTPSSGLTPARLSFFTGSSSGTRIERMRIDATGNVGIGTTSPTALLTVGGTVIIQSYTVATLPACVAGTYTRATVTDALAPTYDAIVVGGGARVVEVLCNGTNWVCH